MSPNNIVYCAGTNNLSGNIKNSIGIAETILETVSFILNNYPKSNLVVVGVLPIKNQKKCHQPQTINNILKYKLQKGAHFAQPPNILQGDLGETFYDDNVHLNLQGYRELYKVIQPLLKPDTTTHTDSKNPVLDDYGIGQAEFLGSGWDGTSPPPNPLPSS